ncbi:TPA: hypothetical protein JD264_09715 [Serratia fonticola]|nr:hypothetical protein [Serratia fonticola]
MNEFLQWLNNLSSVIPSIITGAGAVLYTRWRYVKNRQFSTVSDEKRFETLKRIGDLEKEGDNLHMESMRKTLYESIGMYYSHKNNCYLLQYVNEEGLPYKHDDFNHFLKSASLLRVNSLNRFELNQKKYFWRTVELWAVFILITVVLLPVSFIMLNAASSAKEGMDIFHYLLAGIVGGAWAVLYIGFVRSMQNCLGAKRFYKKFAPWLELKLAEVLPVPLAEPDSTPARTRLIRAAGNLAQRLTWRT